MVQLALHVGRDRPEEVDVRHDTTLRTEAVHILERFAVIGVGVLLRRAMVDAVRGEATVPVSSFREIAALANPLLSPGRW